MAQSLPFFQTTFMDILDEMDECSWLFLKIHRAIFQENRNWDLRKHFLLFFLLIVKTSPMNY